MRNAEHRARSFSMCILLDLEGNKETPTATLKDLSARLQLQGVALSDSAIGKIEKRIRPVTDIQIAAFSIALKASISWLFEESVKLK